MHHPEGLPCRPSAELETVASEFTKGGIDCELHGNLAEARWRKLCWNIPYNGLCTVLDVDTDILRNNPQGRKAVEEIMREVQRAVACGHHIEDSFLELVVRNTDEMGPYLPSMTSTAAWARMKSNTCSPKP